MYCVVEFLVMWGGYWIMHLRAGAVFYFIFCCLLCCTVIFGYFRGIVSGRLSHRSPKNIWHGFFGGCHVPTLPPEEMRFALLSLPLPLGHVYLEVWGLHIHSPVSAVDFSLS